jgi:WD40 repeat protein
MSSGFHSIKAQRCGGLLLLSGKMLYLVASDGSVSTLSDDDGKVICAATVAGDHVWWAEADKSIKRKRLGHAAAGELVCHSLKRVTTMFVSNKLHERPLVLYVDVSGQVFLEKKEPKEAEKEEEETSTSSSSSSSSPSSSATTTCSHLSYFGCLLGHCSTLSDALLSADERFVVSSDRDEKIRISHFPNAYSIHAFALGHRNFVSRVQSVAVDGGEALLSGAGDGTLRLWNFDGKQIAMLDKFTNDDDDDDDEKEKDNDDGDESLLVTLPLAVDPTKRLVAVALANRPELLLVRVGGSDDAEPLSIVHRIALSEPAADVAFYSPNSDETLLCVVMLSENGEAPLSHAIQLFSSASNWSPLATSPQLDAIGALKRTVEQQDAAIVSTISSFSVSAHLHTTLHQKPKQKRQKVN